MLEFWTRARMLGTNSAARTSALSRSGSLVSIAAASVLLRAIPASSSVTAESVRPLAASRVSGVGSSVARY